MPSPRASVMRSRSVRRGRLGHRLDDDGRVHGRRVDLQHLDVVGALELVVHDAGRLQHAVARAERVLALSVVDEPDPTLEDVEHLKVTLVLMQAGGVQVVSAARVGLDTNHVGAEATVRRALDAEVAVLHEAAQPRRVHGVLGAADAEELLGLAHRTYSFPQSTIWPVSMSSWSRRGPIVCMATKPSSTMSQ